MTESQNSGAEGQTCDKIQPIGDSSMTIMVGGDTAADKVEEELGSGVKEVLKRKRGRPPKAHTKLVPVKPVSVKPLPVKKVKEEDEDVCFICFDGGSLVLCDHRGCPKAYHPACIKRDEEFFESAAKWNCGWHICSICQKTAHHMCYTCTYSLCRGCVRKSDYVCVRGDKGFCTICMKTIMLIENNGQGEDGKIQADFDDKLSWEYLFKVYWVYLKGKLSLTLEELTQAKNPWKEASTISSIGVHNTASVSCSITSATSVGDLEEVNESKRRKIDEQVNIQKETVNMEKSQKVTVGCEEWASKELLDFVAHMNNGNTAVLSRFDVHALMLDYIKRNNLQDPKNKNKIICDSRLKGLFGKPRVGHIQMLKLLGNHFAVKEGSRKRRVNRTVQIDPDWNNDNMLTVGKNKKRKNHSKAEECAVQNKLDEFAAVDAYNMNLIYLRRDLMGNLLEDGDSFHGKVVGSIVRIRISGCDLKHDMYRLVQVVGTSKVDVPYKVNSKSTDIMLEVLNLDKKETISIDAISDQEFSEVETGERHAQVFVGPNILVRTCAFVFSLPHPPIMDREECRRLQRSIRCGLVKHFTVGEIQEKALALQSVKLKDWMEREILRLTRLRDIASEKGHKKEYPLLTLYFIIECVEKIQLLKTPDERECRLNKVPQVHSDPKMNPDYESDDTEEYFNKEHGDQMESKYRGKNLRSPKKRENRSRKDERPMNQTITTSPNIEQGSTMNIEKDALASTLEKSQHEVDCNGSTITKMDLQTTVSSSISNSAPETIPPFSSDIAWHYLDPNGKVQGPFSLAQLQRWNTSGYFPADMRIWATHEDKSLLLTDVLKQHLPKFENTTASNNVGNQIDRLTVCSEIPSSTVDVNPYVPDPVNHEKLSDSHSFGQNWSANNDSNNNMNYNPPSVESTVHHDASNTPIQETEKIEDDIKDAIAVPAVVDLPGPMPKSVQSVLDSKPLVQSSGNNNQPSWSSASSLVVGGPKLPFSGNGLGGCNSTPVKREEWDSGFVLEVAGDHVATPTSNIDQNVNPSHQPTCNNFTWHDMGEMIEFSTLAEESVSDLLAEVDAMESQYGLPSPTSRRNSIVDDLFNDSFDEFSPTPDQGTRSDGFSSSGDIQLARQSTPSLNEHINVFDFMKTSNGLQQHSFMRPELNGQETDVSHRTTSGSKGFKWLEMERVPQGMIDINASAKAEGDEGEIETKTVDVIENGNYSIVHNLEPQREMKSSEPAKEMQAPKPIGIGAKLVTRVAQIKWLEGATNHRRAGGVLDKQEEGTQFIQPPPQPHLQPPPPPPPPQSAQLPPLTLGLDPYDPCDLGSETIQGKFSSTGRPDEVTNTGRSGNSGWDPNQRQYGGERYNSSNSPRERSHQVEESGHSRSSRSSWDKHSSFGSSSGGGYSRPPVKGQRVCRFYESGRCKKGASCKNLHPSP
ncbi:hypothetical protein QVD17_04999 [Tagetes erecta]|uniref:Zinc finger CCCH domain-containing protein 44 n=1 Tax=Tagetes erecta TaxID=13708 RepID=A0AAD8LDN6_TARER|nr:hypothetical protein QVD17_04999 [Tagetes erecta]